VVLQQRRVPGDLTTVLRNVVRWVEALAAVAALVFVVLLFANEPDDGEPGGGGGDRLAQGQEIFGDRCAACHGAAGQGLSGPKLAEGRVVERFPDPADQIAVVTDGIQGRMPAFGEVLDDDEIDAVVAYTREGL